MKRKTKQRMTSIISVIGLILALTLILSMTFKNRVTPAKQIPSDNIHQIILSGHLLINDGLSKSIPVKQYFQNREGDFWINDIMLNEGDTISSSGCLLTSFTMLHNYLDSSDDNPCNVNAVLNQSACPFNFDEASRKYGYNYEGFIKCETLNAYKSAAVWCINQNLPVIAELKSGKNISHFVLVTGCNASEIIIKDTDIYRNHSSLDQYLNDGYAIIKFHIIKK